MSTTTAAATRGPLASRNGSLLRGFENIPLRFGDLAPFAGAIAWTGQALAAVHRDADGAETGREWSWPEGRHAFTRGGRRGLVCSPSNTDRRRMAIACGPLPLVCLAAIEDRHDTVYTTPGGVWTAAAAEAVEALVRRWRMAEVVVATSALIAARCVPDLEVRLADTGAHVTSVALPDGGWPGALERLRQGAAAAA